VKESALCTKGPGCTACCRARPLPRTPQNSRLNFQGEKKERKQKIQGGTELSKKKGKEGRGQIKQGGVVVLGKKNERGRPEGRQRIGIPSSPEGSVRGKKKKIVASRFSKTVEKEKVEGNGIVRTDCKISGGRERSGLPRKGGEVKKTPKGQH